MNGARWQLNEREVSSEVIDGELIIMHLKSGKYYSSAGVGPLVWSCVARGLTSMAASEVVAKHCGMRAQDVAADVEAFIASLVSEELLRESPAEPTEAVLEQTGEALVYAKPELQVYSDMKDLLLLDPIHDVSEEGWPIRPVADKVL